MGISGQGGLSQKEGCYRACPVQSSCNIPFTLKYFLQKGEGGLEAFDIKVREKLIIIIIMSKM